MRPRASLPLFRAAAGRARSPPRSLPREVTRFLNSRAGRAGQPARLCSLRGAARLCRYDESRVIEVTPEVAIPDGELTFTASRSGGPGGQNVNKVSTKVTLAFDVMGSPSLSPEEKVHILERLGTRISKDGTLRVVSQRHRSQAANRRAALERFIELVSGALVVDPQRVPTRPHRASREHRVVSKKLRARLKESRRRPGADES